MSNQLPDLVGRVRMDTSDLSAAVGRASATGSAIGAAFGTLAAQGIGAGIRAVKDFVGGAIGAARESEAIGRTTEAVIKATGNAAGLTATQVGDMAERMSGVTGIDDEVIQQGANLLLTFKNVKNGVGEGADVFDRANMAALDLSKAGFGSVDGAAKMLGKALNDPIQGMSALGRAGVTLTEQQKEQIKTLVERGDLLGAQQILLDEVESQVGGVAAATATNGERAKVALGNLQEAIGNGLLPIIDSLAGVFADRVVPGLMTFAGVVRDNVGPVLERLGAIGRGLFELFSSGDVTGGLLRALGVEEDGAVVAVLLGIRDAALQLWDIFQTRIMPVLQQVGGLIRDNLQPILAVLGGSLGGVLLAAVGGLAAALAGPLVAGLAAVFAVLTGPVALIGALAAGLIYAYTQSETFRGLVDQLAAFLMTTVVPALQELAAIVVDALGTAVAWVVDNWPTIQATIVSVLEAVVAFVTGFVATVVALWDTFGGTILDYVTETWANLQQIIGGALDIIMGLFDVFAGLFTGDWSRLWDGIKQVLGGVWEVMQGLVDQALTVLQTAIGLALDAVGALWSAAWEAIKALLGTILDAIVTLLVELPARGVRALASLAGDMLGAAATGFGKLVEGATDKVGAAVTFVGGLPGKAVGALADLASSMLGAASSGFGQLVSGATTKAGELVSFVGGIPGKVVAALGNLGSLLLGAGGNIVDGLARGIRNGVGRIKDALLSLLPGPLKSFAGKLGIASPSKVFQEYGHNIGEGLELGVRQTEGMVERAADALAGAALSSLRPIAELGVDLDQPAAGDTAPGAPGGPGPMPGRAADPAGVVDDLLASLEELHTVYAAGQLEAHRVLYAALGVQSSDSADALVENARRQATDVLAQAAMTTTGVVDRFVQQREGVLTQTDLLATGITEAFANISEHVLASIQATEGAAQDGMNAAVAGAAAASNAAQAAAAAAQSAAESAQSAASSASAAAAAAAQASSSTATLTQALAAGVH